MIHTVSDDSITVSRADLRSVLLVADSMTRWTNESWLARCRLLVAVEGDAEEGQVD